MKKDTISIIICVVCAAIGFIGSNWYPRLGMFIAGCSSTLILLATYGKYLARLAAKRIDNSIQNKLK